MLLIFLIESSVIPNIGGNITNFNEPNSDQSIFTTRINNIIKEDSQKIQTNYIGGFCEQLEFSMDESPRLKGEEVIAFHNGNILDGLGVSGYAIWEASIRITPDELMPYDGWELIGVCFYHWESDSQSGDVKIYDEGTDTSSGNLITSESYNVTGNGWRRINLTNPVPLNITKDIWVSILVNQSIGDYPMGVDDGPAVDGKGDWVYIDGPGWNELQYYGFNFNWGLEAIVNCPLETDANGPYIGIINDQVQFTGSASGGYPPYNYHWDFGDEETSEEQNPTHEYNISGNYTVTLTVTDDDESVTVDTTYALIRESNDPPNKPTITGETQGEIGESYTYTFTVTDPDDDDLQYYIEWDDDTNTGWIGPYNSEEVVTRSHTWDEEGTYTIRAKAKDIFEEESEWETLEVTMPMNQQIIQKHTLLSRFLDRFPNALPIIRYLSTL